jgi:serine/threonine protein phosphatase PrpC
MRLRVVEHLSDPRTPGGTNEDVAGFSSTAAWVLDGATGLSDSPLLHEDSDAAWLARAFNVRLRAEADRADLGLPELLGALVRDVAAEFVTMAWRVPAGRHEEPSAGMVMVRLRRNVLEYGRLGDCRAIISAGGRVVVTGDSPLLHMDEAVVHRMQEVRSASPSLTFGEVRQAVLGELRANRALMNTEGGYWVLGTDPAAALRMEVGSVPLDAAGGAHGLLVSDGFYRLVDTVGLVRDHSTLLDAARESHLGSLLAALRAREDNDPDCVAYPRIKPRDDATALLFEVGPDDG